MMKILKVFLIVITVLVLTSCLDGFNIETIEKELSGTYRKDVTASAVTFESDYEIVIDDNLVGKCYLELSGEKILVFNFKVTDLGLPIIAKDSMLNDADFSFLPYDRFNKCFYLNDVKYTKVK